MCLQITGLGRKDNGKHARDYEKNKDLQANFISKELPPTIQDQIRRQNHHKRTEVELDMKLKIIIAV